MDLAIIRGGNGRRHEVDFGNRPVEFEATVGTMRWPNPRKPGWHGKVQPPSLGRITETEA